MQVLKVHHCRGRESLLPNLGTIQKARCIWQQWERTKRSFLPYQTLQWTISKAEDNVAGRLLATHYGRSKKALVFFWTKYCRTATFCWKTGTVRYLIIHISNKHRSEYRYLTCTVICMWYGSERRCAKPFGSGAFLGQWPETRSFSFIQTPYTHIKFFKNLHTLFEEKVKVKFKNSFADNIHI
jgi:hypothetical protein